MQLAVVKMYISIRSANVDDHFVVNPDDDYMHFKSYFESCCKLAKHSESRVDARLINFFAPRLSPLAHACAAHHHHPSRAKDNQR